MSLPYEQIIGLLLEYKYLIMFPLVMLEGPITTIIAGFLSSTGQLNFWLAYFLAAVADLTSDAGYYFLGRFGREKFIEKYGHYVGITGAVIEKLENQFRKHGGKMLVFGKIADPLSSTIQATAGLTKMNFKKYAFWNVIATFPKSLLLLTIGFYFGEAVSSVNFYQKIIGIIASVAGLGIIAAYFSYRRIIGKKIKNYGKPDS